MRFVRGSVTLVEMALLFLFVVIAIWLWINPLAKSAANAHNADKTVLNELEVLDLGITPSPTPSS